MYYLLVALYGLQVVEPVQFPFPNPDPWSNPYRGDPIVLDPLIVLKISLGGAIANLSKNRYKIEHLESKESIDAIIKIVKEGVRIGLKSLGSDISQFAEDLEQLSSKLQ